MRSLSRLLLVVAAATNVVAQVTETVTPNAEEYAHIKSDIASYGSALQTESLYLAAQSYVQAHSTSVPFVSVVLYTQSWSQGIETLNNLITTEFPSSYPTIVAELYHSVLEEQGSIINADVTHSASVTAPPLVTGTGVSNSSGSANTTYTSPTMQTVTSGSSATSVVPAPSSVANANVMVNGLILAMGLGVAALV